MNALAELYDGQEFVILGFPCNQFGLQEPGIGAAEIMNGITYVRPGNGFIPQMTLFQKTEVNGETEDPIFTFLKSGCEFTDTEYSSDLFYEPLVVGDINWNFEKFLIDKTGKPFARYHPSVTNADDLTSDIEALLAA